MKIKTKYLIIILATVGLITYLAVAAFAEGPSAYVRYHNSGGNVIASVYWNDPGNIYNCQWANDVTASGGALSWSADMSESNTGTLRYVTLTMTKYKNYYFKVYSGSDITIVRAFPGTFNSTSGERYQNDSAHGNFTPDTTMCAACHSTHSALKAQLLRQATYYELCLLCHGSSTSQSKYDVVNGKVFTSDGWKDSLAGPIGTGVGTITSKHNVDDTVDTKVYVPGSDRSSAAKMLTFTCVSCHNGHGGKNDNYRLLKKTVYPSDDTTWNPQTVNFAAYAIVKNASNGEEVYFVSGNTEFCSACHLDYDQGNAWVTGGVYGTSGSIVTANVYKHPVTVGSVVYSVEPDANHPAGLSPTSGDVLPLQYYSGASAADKRKAVVCETCHYAHGTYKTFNVYLPSSGTVVSNQKMLRLDNYGVCQSCHQK